MLLRVAGLGALTLGPGLALLGPRLGPRLLLGLGWSLVVGWLGLGWTPLRRPLALGGVGLLGVGGLGSRGSLGLLGIWGLLLASVWWGAVLAVVALALLTVAPWTLLPIAGHLLSVLHATHATGGASLHAHGVSLSPWGSVALAWVGGTLLSPWRRRALPLLLRVGVDSTVPLASHLPCLVHRAGGLVSVQRSRVPRSRVSWTHWRRMVGPLLPTRMAPTILTAGHICCSLASPFLVTIVSLWVILVGPS